MTTEPDEAEEEEYWEDPPIWLLELQDVPGEDEEGNTTFIRLNDEPSPLVDAISRIIRIGGPITKFALHEAGLLASAMPGYYVETERLEFNLLPLPEEEA